MGLVAGVIGLLGVVLCCYLVYTLLYGGVRR